MTSIGERAAKAIRNRVAQNDTTLTKELVKITASRKVFLGWERKGWNPNAYFLQQMALQGYDIIWVLIGHDLPEQQKGEHPQITERTMDALARMGQASHGEIDFDYGAEDDNG
jgi:hypothetical protein